MTQQSTKVIWITWIILTCAIVAPDMAHHWIEQRKLDALAIKLTTGSTTTREKALVISDAVRAKVQPVADGSFYHVTKRPLLRQTAWATWSHAEGQCGEGARLIVSLLRSVGIPASRIYLFNSSTSFYHTAVVFQDGGESYLLDTVSSPDDFHNWVRGAVPRLRDVVEYFSLSDGAYGYKTHNAFFDTYSYFNWSRILPNSRFEINQHSPLPGYLILLMESPFLLLALIKLIALVALFFGFHQLARLVSWVRSLKKPRYRTTETVAVPMQES